MPKPEYILKIIDVVLNKGILVAIPIVIGVVGSNLSQSLERAKLIDALLDDLINTETRRDIALMALHTGIPVKKSLFSKIDESQSDQVVEIAKILLKDSIDVEGTIRNEAQQIQTKQQSEIITDILKQRRPNTWESILIDISNNTRLGHNDEKLNTENLEQIKQSKEIISNLLPDKIVISINFRGSIKRELINNMREAFQQKDWITPPALRLGGNYENTLKYFYESDEDIAREIKNKTEAFLNSRKCNNKTVKLDLTENLNREEGQIELSIHSSCELKE